MAEKIGVSYRDCLTIFVMRTSHSLNRTLCHSNCWTDTLHFGKDMQMETVKPEYRKWIPKCPYRIPGVQIRAMVRNYSLGAGAYNHPSSSTYREIFPRLSFQPMRTAKWRRSEFHSPYTLHSARLRYNGKLNDYKIIGNSHNDKQTMATARHVMLTTSPQRLSQYSS